MVKLMLGLQAVTKLPKGTKLDIGSTRTGKFDNLLKILSCQVCARRQVVNTPAKPETLIKEETSRISADLVNWAVACNISHIAFTKLLKVLGENGVSGIPKTSQALLQEKENEINVTQVPPGVYVHYGITSSLIRLLTALTDKNLVRDNKIELTVFIDNLPLSQSKNKGLWVILGSASQYKDAIFMIGAYSGTARPNDPNAFLNEFVTEAITLSETGLTVNNVKYTVSISKLVCDAPAKAFILNVVNCMGYSSCTKCDAVGEYVKGKICFPSQSKARTDGDFRRPELYKEKMSNLLDIPNFGVVSNIPLDFMHLVCIGVVKKLISIWVGDRSIPPKNYAFENLLVNYPCEFSNKFKVLRAYMNWSPTQFRQFLLYYGPALMKNYLSKDYYKHFLLLHASTRLLSVCRGDSEMISLAETHLGEFIRGMIQLYGKDHVTHNVHGLYHLADDCRRHGRLDEFSAFPFEKYLNQIGYSVKLSRKRTLPQTILKFAHEALFVKTLEKIGSKEPGTRVKKRLPLDVDDIKHGLPENCHKYERLDFGNGQIIAGKSGDSCALLKNGRLIEVSHVFELDKKFYVVGREFLTVKNFYDSPVESRKLNVFSVGSPSTDLKIWPVEMLDRKCVNMAVRPNERLLIGMLEEDF